MIILSLSPVAILSKIAVAMEDSKYLLVDFDGIDYKEPKRHELGGEEIAALKKGRLQTYIILDQTTYLVRKIFNYNKIYLFFQGPGTLETFLVL